MSAPISFTPISTAGPSAPSSTGRRKGSSKTVAVLGASYGGARAAKLLSLGLPEGWRLVVIDRNSHMNRKFTISIIDPTR